MLPSNNILKPFISLEVKFLFKCPHHKVHSHINIPCLLMITNDQAYMITTKFGCIRLAYHKDLFHSKTLIYTKPMDDFSFLLVHKKLLLFTSFYQQQYPLRKEYLQSIMYLEAILQVFLLHNRWDIMNMRALIHNTDT